MVELIGLGLSIFIILFVLFIVIVSTRNKEERHPKKTFIDENGYRRFIDSGKLVHRWVAEKKLGRPLRGGEIVHHIDHNKLNNSPENLHICKNQEEHEQIHEHDYFERRLRWIGKKIIKF